MLSMAFSMILYGVLVKTEVLGSTDGFNVVPPTYLGWQPADESVPLALYFLTLAVTGLFVIRGKKGIKGRGAWLATTGILIPLLFLWLYF